MKNIWAELRRRHVVRVTIAYAIFAWLLLQVSAILLPAFNAPNWSIKAITFALLIGLPVTIILSWLFDITPEGIVVTEEEVDNSPRIQKFVETKLKPVKLEKLGLANTKLNLLIGRVSECNRIREILNEAKAGHGGIIMIGGEPGLGKTRLAEEALFIGKEMGMLPLIGHAYEEQGAPYILATEIIEEMSRTLPSQNFRNVLGDTASEIARLVPDLRRKFNDIPATVELPPGQQQRYLFNAILEMITRLCKTSPCVVLLDDIHWADESSIQMLEHLTPHIAKLPLIFIITYRDAEIDLGDSFKKALVKLNHLPFVHRVPLEQLSEGDVKELLSEKSSSPPPRELVALIHSETEGNVFFVRSIFQHLNEQGKLFDDNGNWLNNLNIQSLDVPESVRMVTSQRIQQLNEEAQNVLTIAAILGLRFRLKVLQKACTHSEDVLNAIEMAEATELLKPAVGGHELRYEFVHALTRSAILSQLSAARKQRLHVQIADAVESIEAKSLESHAADIAYHLSQSGDAVEASRIAHWLERAGDDSMAATAMGEAIGFYSRALKHICDEPLRASVLHKRAKATLSAGDIEGFESDMRQAFTLYEKLGDEENAAHLCYELGYIFAWKHLPVEAMEIAQKGLELTGKEPSPARCLLLSTMGFALTIAAHTDKSAPLIEQAIDIAKSLDSKELLANALMSQSNMHWFNMNWKPLLESAHKASTLYRELGDDWNLGQCLWMEQAAYSFSGQNKKSDQIRAELEPIALKHENFGPLLCLELFKSMSEQQQGHLENAIRSLKRAVEYSHKGQLPWAIEGQLSLNLILHGNFQKAREAYEYAYQHRMHGGSGEGSNVCFWLYGKAYFNEEDTYDAYLSLKSILPSDEKLSCTGPLLFLLVAIESLALIERQEAAGELYAQVVKIIDQKNIIVPFTIGLTERFAAIAAASGKQWELAESHFKNALDQARTLPHKLEEPRILYWYARMLMDRDQNDDQIKAKELLNESKVLSKKMSMHGHVALIDRLAIND